MFDFCTCCAARSSCRCFECAEPTLQGETASEQEPGGHTRRRASERSYLPSSGLRQTALCRRTHPFCKNKESKEMINGGRHDGRKHLLTSQHLLMPLCCSVTPSVNPTGQCCPTEGRPCWPGKHCPLVGLALIQSNPVSGSQLLQGEQSENRERQRVHQRLFNQIK